MNAKAMIKRANKELRKFKWTDRVKMEVIKDQFVKDPHVEGGKRLVMKIGDTINPHRLMAEQYELDGIAKAI